MAGISLPLDRCSGHKRPLNIASASSTAMASAYALGAAPLPVNTHVADRIRNPEFNPFGYCSRRGIVRRCQNWSRSATSGGLAPWRTRSSVFAPATASDPYNYGSSCNVHCRVKLLDASPESTKRHDSGKRNREFPRKSSIVRAPRQSRLERRASAIYGGVFGTQLSCWCDWRRILCSSIRGFGGCSSIGSDFREYEKRLQILVGRDINCRADEHGVYPLGPPRKYAHDCRGIQRFRAAI